MLVLWDVEILWGVELLGWFSLHKICLGFTFVDLDVGKSKKISSLMRGITDLLYWLYVH